ncbi:MAG: hypothetical protein NTY90_02980 [Candidatus Micrarchaeota archaeon]|nr:hypothetical protein [Candidatus Micrarchaeota archaeon]
MNLDELIKQVRLWSANRDVENRKRKIEQLQELVSKVDSLIDLAELMELPIVIASWERKKKSILDEMATAKENLKHNL